jgi:hypothetical protein
MFLGIYNLRRYHYEKLKAFGVGGGIAAVNDWRERAAGTGIEV